MTNHQQWRLYKFLSLHQTDNKQAFWQLLLHMAVKTPNKERSSNTP